MAFMLKQRTISKEIRYCGIGTHMGVQTQLIISPANDDTGIVFIRDDIDDPNKQRIIGSYRNSVASPLCTKLKNEFSLEVFTVEHLMAALSATGITNAFVHLDHPEMPIFDGSSKEIIQLIKSTGVREQVSTIPHLIIKKEVLVQQDEKVLSISPSDTQNLSIHLVGDFSAHNLGVVEFDYSHSETNFIEQISFARTFGFLKDVEAIREAGLAKGASMDNTVVYDECGKCLNPGGLRADNEHIRHKVLDIIGDLYLCGYPIIGKLHAQCPGHIINGKLLQEIFSDSCNYVML